MGGGLDVTDPPTEGLQRPYDLYSVYTYGLDFCKAPLQFKLSIFKIPVTL